MKQDSLDRRNFLKRLSTGAAVLTLPSFSATCAKKDLLRGSSGLPSVSASSGSGIYFDRFGVEQGLLRRILETGLSRGADFSEVFLQHMISHSVGLEDGDVNRASTTVDLGAGIRVLKGDSTGFAYSEDLSEGALLKAAKTAAAVADSGASPHLSSLIRKNIINRYKVEIPWQQVGIDKKVPILERSDRIARSRDHRISKVSVMLNDESSHILVANSEGLLVEDDQPMAVLAVTCVAEHKGRIETSYQSTSARDGLGFFSHQTIDRTAREAADNTTFLFGAGSAPVGELPVVLAPGIPGILLHEAIGHGMEADFNRKGISIYANRIGQRIAPPEVTIIDEAEGRARGSLNIDDEGTLTESTVLVENGILKSYLHDRISSLFFKVKSTGSGRRQSFRFPPVPRMRNTYMLKGTHAPEEIIRSVEKGLYAEMFSNGQVFIGAGDFTFYLKHGRLIENGKLTRAVKDANLIGNGPKVLEKVAMVGNDLKIHSGAGMCGKDNQSVPVGFGLPTLKVSGMSIGGRQS